MRSLTRRLGQALAAAQPAEPQSAPPLPSPSPRAFRLLSEDPEAVGQQIALIDSGLFSAIPLHELLRGNVRRLCRR